MIQDYWDDKLPIHSIVPLPLTLIDLQDHFGDCVLKISVVHYFPVFDSKISQMKDGITADEHEWPLKVILNTVNGSIVGL